MQKYSENKSLNDLIARAKNERGPSLAEIEIISKLKTASDSTELSEMVVEWESINGESPYVSAVYDAIIDQFTLSTIKKCVACSDRPVSEKDGFAQTQGLCDHCMADLAELNKKLEV